MKYVSKFVSVNPEKKIEKLNKEIYAIEQYCAFMTSLDGVQYNASSLMARKVECERKIVRIRIASEEKMK